MKTHKQDANHRTGVFPRLPLTVIAGLAVAVWVCAAGVSLAADPGPGVCCHQCSCLEAFERPDGWYECNGVVQQDPFGGSCQGMGACYYSNDTCESCDGYCCYGVLHVLGESCESPMACCDSDPEHYGDCWVDPPPVCEDSGDYPSDESSCSNDPCDIRTCCLPVPGPYGDFCDILYFSECIDEGGEPQAQGAPWCGSPSGDTDDDGVIDPCDNCPNTANGPDLGTCMGGPNDGQECDEDADCTPGDCHMNQEDGDSDEVGDVCDNCPEDANTNQEDLGDGDGVGDVCDNCPNTDNGPVAGTCMGGPNNGEGCDEDADCTPCDCNMDQEDCDTDGEGDVCEPNCDGDCNPDDCDTDIDGDGVTNADDRCDFTPSGASIVTNPNSPFYGTLRSDLDGDCDVDEDDADILEGEETGAGCQDGEDVEDQLCPTCPACNSCCWQQW